MDITSNAAIGVAEASTLLGLSRRHVLRLIQRGDFSQVYKHEGIRGPYLLDRREVESLAGQRND